MPKNTLQLDATE